MRSNSKSSTRGFLAAACTVAIAGSMAFIAREASAVPIASDLSIAASIELSDTFSDGNVGQLGSIDATSGGVNTFTGFSTSPGIADGVDDLTTSLPSPNPLAANLTDVFDGVGWFTDLDAPPIGGTSLPTAEYRFAIDMTMNLANASAVDTYTVTLGITYSASADAGSGGDASAEATLDVTVDSVFVGGSDILSDTLFGGHINGIGLPPGVPASDAGLFTVDVVLAPGASALMEGALAWEGGVFSIVGASHINLNGDIEIWAVSCSGPCGRSDPTAVPEPASFALFGAGLAGLGWLGRRRRG